MRSRLFLAVFLIAATAALVAQQPTFRGNANFVRVDMYATQDGQAVSDLGLEDVDLVEDGASQTIETFEHVQVRAADPPEARARVFVIFLDTYHTPIEGSANMRLPLVRFLDRVLGADDLVAVMTPEMAATDISFGRKTTIISDIMQEQWTWGRRGRVASGTDPKEELYLACFPDVGDSRGVAAEMRDRRREQMTLDALEALVVHLRGLREERKAVLAVTEGWRLFTENRDLGRVTGERGAQGRPGLFTGRARVATRRDAATGVDRSECDADRVALSMMNNTRRVRDLTDAANRANVSFYPVYPRGLAASDAPVGPEQPPAPAGDRANLFGRQNNLRELAENTDGLAVVDTNDIDGAIRRIVADLSSYYLLGYYSTNAKLDGRFRNITIRVKRPGIQVRARRGYRGLTAGELVTAAEAAKGTPDRAAGSRSVVVNPRAPFRIRTSAWAPTSNGGQDSAVWVVGELDSAMRKELTWTAGATVEVVVLRADGSEIAASTLEMTATQGAFAVRLPAEGGVGPGEYAVRVRVRPNADPGLPVSDTARVIVPDMASALGEPLMWRRGPSTGPRYLVTADQRFRRNERVRLELPTAVAGSASARMLDRLGRPMEIPAQVTERSDPSGMFRWIVVDATLAPLAPGDYAIEVTLADGKQLGAFTVVP